MIWKKKDIKIVLSVAYLHNAVLEPSKIVSTQCHAKFYYKDVQSTILTILVEKSDPMPPG